VGEAKTALAVVPTSQNLAARCDPGGGDQASACRPDRPALVWILSGVRREAEHVMRWGDDALAHGSVGAARNIYRYAAREMRWPAAALALAATYDPHELELLAPLVSPDEKGGAQVVCAGARDGQRPGGVLPAEAGPAEHPPRSAALTRPGVGRLALDLEILSRRRWRGVRPRQTGRVV